MAKNKKNKNAQSAKKNNGGKQELTRLGAALRTLGGIGGGVVGGVLGQSQLGSQYGTSLGATLSRWLGSGDYTVKSNTIVSKSLKASSSIPFMHSSNQTVTIRHKEFLCEVRGSTAFTVQRTFEINPGLNATFSWLSGIACQFQEYTIKGIVFHYIPTSGGSTTPALGSVMLQTSYRSNDSLPTSKIEMLNEYWSSEAVPVEAFCHPLECNPSENPYKIQYVRTKAVPNNDNKLLYDLGATYLATSGQSTDGGVLGDLWVTYEVELKKPIVESNTNISVLAATYYCPGNSVSPANMLGNNSTRACNYGTDFLTFTGNVLTITKGYSGRFYIVYNFYTDGTVSNSNMTASAGTNCRPCLDFPSVAASAVSSGNSNAYVCICVEKVDPSVDGTVNFYWGSSSATGTYSAHINIVRIDTA